MHRLVLLLALGGLAPAQVFDSYAVSTVMVPMRDGVKLATDIYLPARGGAAVGDRFPVLVYRSPYNKRGQRTESAFFAQRGYAVVAQDCRGRYASQGEFTPYASEGRDGYDTIEWAAAQAWSNGKVGTAGASYLGLVQYLAAIEKPPHLLAMFALAAGSGAPMPGGVPDIGSDLWLVRMALTSPRAPRVLGLEKLQEFQADPGMVLKMSPGERAALLRNFPSYYAAYETPQSLAERYSRMKDVPIFFHSGWYDFQVEGLLENFVTLSRLQKTPKKLMVGPWPHSAGAAECGDAWFGPRAAVEIRPLELDWFDHWLRQKEYQIIKSDSVEYFRMGGGPGTRTAGGKLDHGGEWRTAASWPPAGGKPVRYYLQAGGALSNAKPGAAPPSTYLFDPSNPVPTAGGRTRTAEKAPGCVQDQGRASRADVLTFSTPPLARPLNVTGRMRAVILVSSDAPETDFTAKLIDLYPDGYAFPLNDGQIRTRYSAGQVHAVEIDLGSISNLFARGHRIRLDLSSSSYPKFEPNHSRPQARNSVWHDARHASLLELPVPEP